MIHVGPSAYYVPIYALCIVLKNYAYMYSVAIIQNYAFKIYLRADCLSGYINFLTVLLECMTALLEYLDVMHGNNHPINSCLNCIASFSMQN